MTIAIGFVNVTTSGTTLRGMTRIDFDDFKTEPRRFVAQKLFQLVECPSVHIPALLFSQLARTVTNPVQLLNCNRWTSGAMGESHNPFAHHMINVSLKTPLPTRQPFQNTPNRSGVPLCLFLLESSAGIAVAVTNMLGVTPTEKSLLFAIGDNGDTGNAPINTHHRVVGFLNVCHTALERYAQIHLTFARVQATIAKLPLFQVFSQLRFALERNLLGAAFKGRNRETVGRKTEVTPPFTALQHDRLPLEEYWLFKQSFRATRRRILAGDHPNGTGGNLSRKVEIHTHGIVSQLVQPYSIGKVSVGIRDSANPVASVCPLDNQSICRFVGQINLKLRSACNFLHIVYSSTFVGKMKEEETDNSPPSLRFSAAGCLTVNGHVGKNLWQEALEGAGIQLSVWRIHRRIGMSGGLFVDALLRETGHTVTPEEATRLQKLHAEAYKRLSPQVRVLPGARELLDYLTGKGVPWAIATSGRIDTARPILDMLKIGPEVTVITRDQVRYAKPDPDLFLAAAERLNVPITSSVVVGDSVWDLLAAQRVHALGVGLLSGGYGQDELERAGAYRVYQDPADMLRFLYEIGVRTAE